MKKFFKKNAEKIIWVSAALLLGVILGWTVSSFCPWPNLEDNASVNCNNLELNNQNEIGGFERTIIDGIILAVDLPQESIEISAMNFTSLNDLERTKSVSQSLVIKITENTKIILIKRENNQEKLINAEEMLVNDSVAVIVPQDLIDSFAESELTADIIKVIR